MSSLAGLTVGTELPSVTLTPSRLALVRFAAGSGDFNPLHFDPDFPQVRPIGDNVVHGRLKHALLGRLVSDWLEHRGRLVSLRCEYRRIDLRDRPVTARGRVDRIDSVAGTVELALRIEDAAGTVTATGHATVLLNTLI